MPITLDTDPLWLAFAQADLGLREIPGKQTAPKIKQWLIDLRAWWTDDETPWCGTALAAWMTQAGIDPPKAYFRAKSWLDWGLPIQVPRRGCIVVFGRDGGGHVGIVTGKTPDGQLTVLGGNQGDSVSERAFPTSRVLGYRIPRGDRFYADLPIINADGSLSEA